MRIEKDGIVLRDFIETDIEDEVRWETVETDWMEKDTPWEEIVPQDPDTVRDDMRTFFMMALRAPESVMRPRLEIEADGRHVGFVSSYFLKSDYTEADYDPFQTSEGRKHCLGIAICEPSSRGAGIGTKALSLWIGYHRDRGIKEVCLETWPGNGAMLRCAEKLGFRVVKVFRNAHERNGEKWDDTVLSLRI